jgi:hypothetical protein
MVLDQHFVVDRQLRGFAGVTEVLETGSVAGRRNCEVRISNDRAMRNSKLEFSCWTKMASLCRITEETMDSMFSAVTGMSSMNSSSSVLSSGGGIRDILS